MNEKIKEITIGQAFVLSKFRESRNKDYSLSFLDGDERYEMIKGLDVINVVTNEMEKL